jgi:hypothetical protein
MEAQQIPDDVLRAVYASDQAMYPVPLCYTRLRAWVDACPDLSICFFRDSESGAAAAAAVGVVIALPLQRPYWEDLLTGRLKEMDIDPGRMFPALRASQESGGGHVGGEEVGEAEEIGLHVYHIERFDSGVINIKEEGRVRSKGVAELALEEVERRARLRSGWRVVGMSGMCLIITLPHEIATRYRNGNTDSSKRLQLRRQGKGRFQDWALHLRVIESYSWSILRQKNRLQRVTNRR